MTVRGHVLRRTLAIGMRTWLIFGVIAIASCVPAMAQTELTRKVKTKVDPPYPALARKLNIRGTVKFLVVVTPAGELKETKVVGGNPILVDAALDALKQWKFEPSAEPSTGTVEFKFQPE
jgi:TonB family protein